MSKKSLFCHLFSAIVFLMIFLGFFGCNNLTGGNNKPSNDNDDKVYLQVNVASASRTALPQFDLDSIKDFKFELEGKKDGASSFTAIAIFEDEPDNLDNLKNEQIPIETGAWIFRLIASKDGTILSDEKNETIKTGSNNLSFNLKWDDTNLSGTGSLSFSLDFSAAANKNEVTIVKAQLFDYNPSTHTQTVNSSYPETQLTYTQGSGTVTYSQNTVAAGNYRLKINLYAKDNNTNENILIFTWPELVIITGGQASTSERTLSSLNKVYTIEWDGLDGINETLTLPAAYTRLNDEYTLPTISKDDYIFGGWYDSADFENGNIVTSIAAGSTEDKHFYARWRQIYATINGIAYADKESTFNAIKNATGNINVVLRGIVPESDLVSSAAIGRIMNGIKNTSADSVSLSVASGETIILTESQQNCFSNCPKLISLDMTGFDTSAVTSMQEMFTKNTALTTLILPATFNTSHVTNMTKMFKDCSSLETLDCSNFDTSVVKYMNDMFNGCTSLENLNVSSFDTSHLESIYSMFEGCSSLESIDISSFRLGSSLTTINALFKGCSNLGSIDLSNFDTSNIMGMSEFFSGCENLTTLNLSSFNTANVNNMDEMFKDCKKLTTITVSDSFVHYQYLYGDDMFSGCTSLAGSRSTTYSGDNANNETYAHVDGGSGYPGYFTSSVYAKVGSTTCADVSAIATAIEAATSNIDITIFGDGSFTASNLSTINSALRNLYDSDSSIKVTIDLSYLGELTGLEDVAENVANALATPKSFSKCQNITTITLPPGLQSIGSFAFLQCISLSTINVPGVVNYYDGITLPDSLVSIGKNAFYGCSGIGYFTIPSNINFTALAEAMLQNCTNIEYIEIPSNILSIGANCFNGCTKLETLRLDSSTCALQEIGNYAFNGCTSLDNVTLFTSVKTLGNNTFSGCSNLQSITLSGVETVGDYCFQNCTNLYSINLSVIKNMGNYVFYGCTTLRTVSLSNYLTALGNNVFDGCEDLDGIDLPNSLLTLGNNVFLGCSSLDQISLPASVTTMGNAVFKNCTELREFIIPSSVTSIGYNFCSGCTSLQRVIFQTTTGWKNSNDETVNVSDDAANATLFTTGLSSVTLSRN